MTKVSTKLPPFQSSHAPKAIKLASRKSKLALWQAQWIKTQLETLGHTVSLVLIETQGDKNQEAFAKLSGQGFFTKAIQMAVLNEEADIAVHSYKDLPSMPTPGLDVAAVSKRADPRDVLIVTQQALDTTKALNLKDSACVGTSAVRRQKQLKHLRPDLEVKELRGNVPTRINKLKEGHYDAIVLAAAGIDRLALDLSEFSLQRLDPSLMVSAPAQGALALEIRRDSYELASILTDLHDGASAKAIAAERGLMSMLQGGCQLALGAHAYLEENLVHLGAWYEGQYVQVKHPSSEGAAMLAFEALGRPQIKGQQ